MLIQRYEKNPILKPKSNHSWEAEATFNPCPVKKGDKIYLLYRAISLPHYRKLTKTVQSISSIGVGVSDNGIDFHDRKRLIIAEEEWEKFGCEDPRVTKLGDKYFIFYTALSTFPFTAEGIKVGVAISRDLEKIDEKHLVTPFNAKAMALFPERINGKIFAIFSIHTDKPPTKICLASFDKEEEIWDQNYWNSWYKNYEKYALPLPLKPQDHMEVGAPPIKTNAGWLLIYSYIKNYFGSNRLFTVQAALLDLKNPFKVLGCCINPLLVPEEYYEKIGYVPNVVFPSGALLMGNKIYLYYGAADTVSCLAFIDLDKLINRLLGKRKVVNFLRAKENPIITPISEHSWESKATFNPGAIYLNGKVHIVYRAMSWDNTSVLGYATSKDGIHIDYRSEKPIYVPREPFEQKLEPGANSGCEDPRLTLIGDKIYMCYTAFDGKNPPRVALTWIKVDDFLNQNWNWAKPVLISAPGMDDKDACIFPEKVEGKYFIIHRSGEDIDSALVDSLDFDGKTWIEEYRWVSPRKGWWDSKKIGAAAPPIKTKNGWILIYHGISDDNVYRVGALLLDLENPTKIIGRTPEPIFEPEMHYEKQGNVPNVVFPCGAVEIKDNIFMYYGGADKVVGVATIKTKELLKAFEDI
jgi:predicted GH43/DUF377 family glycosyl hydrolase